MDCQFILGETSIGITMDWDQYFMSMAYLVAMKSKDASTKVGSVAVDDEHEILATGYNGFPRGFDDSDPARKEKPTKLIYMIHSENNTVISAARKGISLKGSTMYVTWCPCDKCALTIVQAGVKEVVTHKENPIPESWAPAIDLAKEILSEGGVIHREWSGRIITPVMFTGGKIIQNPLDAM
jgi:dCMP deaminase